MLPAVSACLLFGMWSVPVAAQEALPPPLAQDARSLSDESASTQALFTAVCGDQAPARWIEEHDLDLAGGNVPAGPRIAVVYQGVPTAINIRNYLAGFIRGLRDAGYAPGEDLLIDWRFAGARLEVLPGLADELVVSQPAVIVVVLPQMPKLRASSQKSPERTARDNP